jgi:DoxX-like family
MFIAAAVVSALFAAALAYSAVRKLSHDAPVVASYAAADVPEEWLNRLALVLLAGAVALLVGLAWAPLGVAAAGALLAYFAVAISFHLRNGDAEHLPIPLAMAALAAAALVLRVVTL